MSLTLEERGVILSSLSIYLFIHESLSIYLFIHESRLTHVCTCTTQQALASPAYLSPRQSPALSHWGQGGQVRREWVGEEGGVGGYVHHHCCV
jgi:hypothetical protein